MLGIVRQLAVGVTATERISSHAHIARHLLPYHCKLRKIPHDLTHMLHSALGFWTLQYRLQQTHGFELVCGSLSDTVPMGPSFQA